MRLLYNTIFLIFGIVYLPYLIITKRYKYGLKEKLGFLPDTIKKLCSSDKIIWIHAVSVGEMKAAGIIAPLLRKAFPFHIILFSSVTHTGNKIAKTIIKGREQAFYLPFDISFITDKAAAIIKPEIFISLETELWPNLIYSLSNIGSKLILINGRISDRSYHRYKKVKFLVSKLLNKFSLILMQSDQDAVRILSLGAAKEKVFVTGNLKFDLPLLDCEHKRLEIRKKLNIADEDILLVAGSTHKGEEDIIIEVFSKLKAAYNDLKLLIAPRHIERTKEIERLLDKSGYKAIKYSQLITGHRTQDTGHMSAVYILDTIGDLRTIYAASDIVFVGGSLIKRGGQNPIEPASLGKPIIFGKFTFNFQDAIRIFLENEAGIEVSNKEELYSAIRFLLDNVEERKKLGLNAKYTVDKNLGSSLRTIDLILK